MVFNSSKDMNAEMTAVCDIWDYNREKAVRYVEKRFGKEPRKFKYLEDMLNLPDLDGVMIATGDHQHAKILVEVVKAGKDCYCEKPMANTLEDAKLARDTVVNSKQIVQIGTQHRCEPFQLAVRDIIRSGVIGKVSKIEQVWNYYGHRWRDPEDSDNKRIREEGTDWNRWLLERKYRPFDPKVYFEF